MDFDIGVGKILEAARWLQNIRVSTGGAISGLRMMSQNADLLGVYREIFPREFQLRGVLKQPLSKDSFTKIRRGFLDLVDSKFFPVPCMLEDELEYGNLDAMPDLYIHPMQDDWWYADPDNLSLLWLVFIAVNDEKLMDNSPVENELARRLIPKGISESLPLMGRGLEYDWDKLRRLCSRQCGPLKSLYTALSMFYHSTGSVWLDMSSENCQLNADWCKRDLNWLAREYKQACKIESEVDELNRWIERDYSMILQVRELLAASVKVEVQVRVGHGAPLVEVLADAGVIEV